MKVIALLILSALMISPFLMGIIELAALIPVR